MSFETFFGLECVCFLRKTYRILLMGHYLNFGGVLDFDRCTDVSGFSVVTMGEEIFWLSKEFFFKPFCKRESKPTIREDENGVANPGSFLVPVWIAGGDRNEGRMLLLLSREILSSCLSKETFEALFSLIVLNVWVEDSVKQSGLLSFGCIRLAQSFAIISKLCLY